MKNSNLINKLSMVTASALFLALSASSTYAANFTLSKSVGIWTGVTGGSNVNGIGTKEVRWGIPNSDKGQSGLKFKGVGLTNFDVDETFQVGTLTHFNNRIFEPASAVSFQINLDFANPDVYEMFSFNFDIDETLNIKPCLYPGGVACADKIDFPNSLPSESFSVMGKNYTLELLGFGSDPDNFTSEFITKEGKKNKTNLFARITETKTEAVPEPTSALALLVLGAVGTSSVIKSKK